MLQKPINQFKLWQEFSALIFENEKSEDAELNFT